MCVLSHKLRDKVSRQVKNLPLGQILKLQLPIVSLNLKEHLLSALL